MKKSASKFKNRKNQKGLAMVETLPILIIFIMLIGYGLGFFGVVHSSILNSISARAYAFQTFGNRVNLEYFRETPPSNPNILYSTVGNRTHAISKEGGNDGQVIASTRNLAIGREVERSFASQGDHNESIFNINGRNREGGVEVSPVWIMVGYGICLDTGCGD